MTTSTKEAPWYIVPADDRRNARLIVSHILLDAFNELDMAFPRPNAIRRRELRDWVDISQKGLHIRDGRLRKDLRGLENANKAGAQT